MAGSHRSFPVSVQCRPVTQHEQKLTKKHAVSWLLEDTHVTLHPDCWGKIGRCPNWVEKLQEKDTYSYRLCIYSWL